MRSLMQNAALAGQTWKAPTSGRSYAIDDAGLASIFDDDEARGTRDHAEAAADGFADYHPGDRVAMKSADYGRKKSPREVAGNIEMVESGPRAFVATGSGHQYHADDAGRIDFLAVDVDEAKAAGFEPA